MEDNKPKPLRICLRLADGWSDPIENEGQERCDIDGERLWISPGGQIYCDAVHTLRGPTNEPTEIRKASHN